MSDHLAELRALSRYANDPEIPGKVCGWAADEIARLDAAYNKEIARRVALESQLTGAVELLLDFMYKIDKSSVEAAARKFIIDVRKTP